MPKLRWDILRSFSVHNLLYYLLQRPLILLEFLSFLFLHKISAGPFVSMALIAQK